MTKLEIKNLKIKIEKEVVVSGASFSVESGESHVIMGSNGSGKSSLLNAIFSHPKYNIVDGSVLFDGKDITTLSADEKAKSGLFLSMQYLPEIEGITLATFLHKIYIGVKGVQISVLDFHKHLTDVANSVGISTELLSKPLNSGLSGGQKKQSELLQLMVLKPKFAFLDEIDSGVDIDSLEKIFKAIKELKKNGTGVVLVTHYPNILSKITPDHVHVMKFGKMIKSGGVELINEIEKSGFKELE